MGEGIKNLRQLALDDIDTLDVTRLTIVSQDHWHLLQRFLKLANKKSPDFPAFKAESSRIVSAGSCRYNAPFSAATPAALHDEALHVASTMRTQLSGLIAKYRWQATRESREERLDCDVRSLGAALVHKNAVPGGPARAVQRGPDTAPAAVRQHGLPIGLQDDEEDIFRQRSLPVCNMFETVSADVVRSAPSFAHMSFHDAFLESVNACALAILVTCAGHCRPAPTQILAAQKRTQPTCCGTSKVTNLCLAVRHP